MDKEKRKILFVDDERRYSALTAEYLESRGYDVILTHSGQEGLHAFKSGNFDLCILDIKMPVKDGFTLAKEIRQLDEYTPYIFLTGQIRKEDRIKGLTLGADDYIIKPYSMQELELRINNILNRVKFQEKQINKNTCYSIGSSTFDSNERTLTISNSHKKLTAIESKLLELFCKNPNTALDRDLILGRIWGDNDMLHTRSLNVYVSKLRKYLAEESGVEILNIHGHGYKMIIKSA